jgi:hypothetical protein
VRCFATLVDEDSGIVAMLLADMDPQAVTPSPADMDPRVVTSPLAGMTPRVVTPLSVMAPCVVSLPDDRATSSVFKFLVRSDTPSAYPIHMEMTINIATNHNSIRNLLTE